MRKKSMQGRVSYVSCLFQVYILSKIIILRFEDECYELDKPGGPCGPIEEGGGIFGVNATTLVVECLKGTDLISLNYVLPENHCPKASIRRYGRKCKKNSRYL